MNYPLQVPVWKQAPFIRLLAPLVSGIVIQWHFPIKIEVIGIAAAAVIFLAILLPLLFKKYYLRLLQVIGAMIMLLVFFFGCWLVFRSDVRNDPYNITNSWKEGNFTRLVISEPLAVKEKSYKALARVMSLYDEQHQYKPASGSLYVYFKKDSSLTIKAGDEIVFSRPLQPVGNTGNPGAMDYRRYCLYQGITHQVFLKQEDFMVVGHTRPGWLNRLLWNLRDFTIDAIRKNIPGEKEQGVAEALLIGYRNDMDRELTQAYSNTGAVHVIAISGMHLGLIYLLTVLLFKPFARNKITRWLKPLVVIIILWLFTLVAGAAPSILRSAVMFTCIAVAESSGRKTNIFNTLAASAFILLCINPFSLWDVGFRLSYAAVLSIVIFMKPVYRLIHIKNKWLDHFWKLNAVTISAQVLTLPVVIFHFHQFPNLFLVANIVAVPLSSLILLSELALMAFSIFPVMATFMGKVIGIMISALNYFIEWCGHFSFAVTARLQMNGWECACLFGVIIFLSYWLFYRSPKACIITAIFILMFGSLRLYAKTIQQLQQKVIVYHVPGRQAMDFISSNHFYFKGSDEVKSNPLLNNFHILPARVQYNVREGPPASFSSHHPFYFLGNRTVLVLDSSYRFIPQDQRKIKIDLLVLSNAPRIYLNRQAEIFDIRQAVADGSNPAWKIKLWKKDCDSLHIPFHQTALQGAFLLDCR